MDHGPVWPEYWNKEELEKVKATLPVGKWNAQWMQQPNIRRRSNHSNESGGEPIPKKLYRHYNMSYNLTIQLFIKKETSDYSAITTWGIWYPSEDEGANLYLLDAIKGRYEFPELKESSFTAI